MEKKDTTGNAGVNITPRYLADNNTTTTMIKHSPTSPTTMGAEHQQHASHHEQHSRENVYTAIINTTGSQNDNSTNTSLRENLDSTTASSQLHNLHQQPQHRQTHAQSHAQLHTHSEQQVTTSYQASLKLSDTTISSNSSNIITSSSTSANTSTVLMSCSQNITYPRQKPELPLTSPTAESELMPIETANGRPPPPSYQNSTSSQSSVAKLYNHNTLHRLAESSTTSNTTCTNEMVSSTANDSLTAPAAVVSTRLNAYEQFLKLSAQECTTATENAVLNLSSAAAAAAAMAAAAIAKVTGAVSSSSPSSSSLIGDSVGGESILSNVDSTNNNSSLNDLPAQHHH